MKEYIHTHAERQEFPNRMPSGSEELLHVGDKLIVARDLSEGDNARFGVNDEMEDFKGTNVTIETEGWAPRITEDGCRWSWSCQMFENIVARGDKLYKVVHGETPKGEGYFLEYIGKSYGTPLNEEVEVFEF